MQCVHNFTDAHASFTQNKDNLKVNCKLQQILEPAGTIIKKLNEIIISRVSFMSKYLHKEMSIT